MRMGVKGRGKLRRIYRMCILGRSTSGPVRHGEHCPDSGSDVSDRVACGRGGGGVTGGQAELRLPPAKPQSVSPSISSNKRRAPSPPPLLTSKCSDAFLSRRRRDKLLSGHSSTLISPTISKLLAVATEDLIVCKTIMLVDSFLFKFCPLTRRALGTLGSSLLLPPMIDAAPGSFA